MNKNKFIFVATIAPFFNFFKGQLSLLEDYFDIYIVASPHEELYNIEKRERIKAKPISIERNISLIKDVKSLFKLLFLFIKLKPQIVHGNTPKGALLAMIAAYISRVPRRIYMCHGLRYQGYSGKMKKLLMCMEKISCICATEVLCVSNSVKNTLELDNICKTKTKVVFHGSANGIDLKHFNPAFSPITNNTKDKYGLKKFVFIFIGRIVKDKGINELVTSFDKLSNVYSDISLLIVGEREDTINPISKEVDRIIQTNENIVLTGRQSDIRPFLLVSDVLVLPSYREGFGVVLMEAGAMNIPVIASDVTGCKDVVNHENGYLVPPRDTESLYNKMNMLYINEEERNRIKEATRQSISSRFDHNTVCNEYLKEYLNV